MNGKACIVGKETDNQNLNYQIKGMVIHAGLPETGYYSSILKTDDILISQIDERKIFEVALGGDQEWPGAYLLLYQKEELEPISLNRNLNYSETDFCRKS